MFGTRHLACFAIASLGAWGYLDLPVSPRHHLPEPTPQAPQPPRDELPPLVPRRPVFAGEGLQPGPLVYVVDKSSSMVGERWARAKQLVVSSVAALPEGTEYNVLVYDSHVPPYYAFRSKLTTEPADAVAAWLEGHQPLASTSTAPAVLTAYQWSAHVVLLTDGEPNVIGGRVYNPQHHRNLIRQGNPGVTVDVFGLQLGDLARAFCVGVATDNGGSYFEVR